MSNKENVTTDPDFQAYLRSGTPIERVSKIMQQVPHVAFQEEEQKPKLRKRVSAVAVTILQNPRSIVTETIGATVGIGTGYGISLIQPNDFSSSSAILSGGIVLGLAAGAFTYVGIKAYEQFRKIPSRVLFKHQQRASLLAALRTGNSQSSKDLIFVRGQVPLPTKGIHQ